MELSSKWWTWLSFQQLVVVLLEGQQVLALESRPWLGLEFKVQPELGPLPSFLEQECWLWVRRH